MTGEERYVPHPELSGFTWRKSTRSSNFGNCVEIAHLGTAVAARDSKDPDGGILRVTSTSWSAFLRALRRDRFTG